MLLKLVDDKKRKICLLKCCTYTFLFSMIGHGFSYFNIMPQSDSLNYVFTNETMGEIALGRYLLPVYYSLVSKYSVPILTGAICALFLGLTVYLLSKLFEVDSEWGKIVLSGLLVCNVSITEINGTFQYILGSCSIAVFLSVLGAYILIRKDSYKLYFLSIICFILTTALYQGEIVAAVIVFILYLIKSLLENKEKRCLILKGIKFVAVLVLSIGIYYLIYKILLHMFHIVGRTGYNSFSNVMDFDLDEFLVDSKQNMINYFSYFFGKNSFVGIGTRIANILLFGSSFIALIAYIRKKQLKVSYVILIILFIISLSFVSTIMIIAMKLKKIRCYVCYPMFLSYLLPFILINKVNIEKNFEKIGMIGLCAVIIFQNCAFSNKTYTLQKVLYERTNSLMTQIESDLCDLEDYVPGSTKVVAIGRLYKNEYLYNITENYDYFVAFDKSSITYTATLASMSKMLGLTINCETDESIIHKYEQDQSILDMPSFPRKGYIKEMNGAVIIKLSTWSIDEY